MILNFTNAYKSETAAQYAKESLEQYIKDMPEKLG